MGGKDAVMRMRTAQLQSVLFPFSLPSLLKGCVVSCDVLSCAVLWRCRQRCREVLFVRDSLLLANRSVLSASSAASATALRHSTLLSPHTSPQVWTDLCSRLSLDRVALMGHSFGGATTILAVQTDQRLRPAVYDNNKSAEEKKEGKKVEGEGEKVEEPAGRIAACVLHDTWTEPLTDQVLFTALCIAFRCMMKCCHVHCGLLWW
jgi:hypothetical protein